MREETASPQRSIRPARRDSVRMLMGVLLAAIPVAAAEIEPVYVNSRTVALGLSTAGGRPTAVQAWMSANSGQTWAATQRVRLLGQVALIDVESDGRFAFYLVAENAAGRSGEPPEPGSGPHAVVVVDTLAPTVQVHAADSTVDAGERLVRLRLSLIDEHLTRYSTRLFWRPGGGGEWVDGGLLSVTNGIALWTVPEALEGSVELRLVVTDRAGNRSEESVPPLNVAARVAAPTVGAAGGGAAASQPAATSQPAAQTPQEPAADLLDRVLAAEGEELSGGEKGLPVAKSSEVASLRALAARLAAEGQFSVASARLDDALRIAPDDSDLLADAGGLLIRRRRYDAAGEHFRTALEKTPDHIGALEGLALVSMTQRRYANAREHLARLVTLAPRSARFWLRYGDAEYRLGNRRQAEEAWRKALELDGGQGEFSQRARRRLQHLTGATASTTDSDGTSQEQQTADRRSLRR